MNFDNEMRELNANEIDEVSGGGGIKEAALVGAGLGATIGGIAGGPVGIGVGGLAGAAVGALLYIMP